jgi:DNA invertase Pin-like site-specific DNA recombinase
MRAAPKPVRCAIYTRKSTEEGLDQAFNSLDAQREACAAYVMSQVHEGWELLPDFYDDGGISGGTMERPALQRLLGEVKAGRVDVIVVYKVDRLTRRLVDFAKIVEVLDEAGASFVSVTQAFNTTNSMGRLTLNVLLSFAQFEREVTGERIRDKIAASKKKGMWMGGPVPFGYDVVDRRLVVNESEAEQVRLIFTRYLVASSFATLADDLAARGVRSKLRPMRDGRVVGGTPFRAGGLRHLLANRIYLGEVNHRGQIYPGEHPAIISPTLWEQVQQRLRTAASRPRSNLVSPLAGRLGDSDGRSLIPAHANKGGKRYRYYVSSTRDNRDGWRLPAGDLEAMVRRTLNDLLADPQRISAVLGAAGAAEKQEAHGKPSAPAISSAYQLRHLLERLDGRVTIDRHWVRLALDRLRLAEMVGVSLSARVEHEPIEHTVPTSLQRRGQELRLVLASPDAASSQPDPRLVDLLGRSWAAWQQLAAGPRPGDPAKRSHLARLARLRFLAPDITLAILEGRQPVELTPRSLLRISELPVEWQDQRRALGF